MAAQRMTALSRDPTLERGEMPEVGEADAARVAEGVLVDVLRRLRHDRRMLRDYFKLGLFVAHAVLVLVVLALQLGVFVQDYTVTYAAVRDSLYAISADAVTEASPDNIRGSVASWDVFAAHLEGVVGATFLDATCGGGRGREKGIRNSRPFRRRRAWPCRERGGRLVEIVRAERLSRPHLGGRERETPLRGDGFFRGPRTVSRVQATASATSGSSPSGFPAGARSAAARPTAAFRRRRT